VVNNQAVPVSHTFPGGLSRVAEPVILFPLIATLVLSVIWTGTIGLIRLKQADAAHDAAASSRELLGTYEAQVVRALREIDQTLTLVKFVHEGERGHGALAELRNKGLLPPDLLFTVSIADRQGAVVESTHPAQTVDVADEKYFQAQRAGDSFIISEPAREPTGDVSLRFSRRLDDSDGTFDGVVIVTVGASYFVSGYESTKLGERGCSASSVLTASCASGEQEIPSSRVMPLTMAIWFRDPTQWRLRPSSLPAVGMRCRGGPVRASFMDSPWRSSLGFRPTSAWRGRNATLRATRI